MTERRRTKDASHIYVIQTDGACKIGVTSNVAARVKMYVVHCPTETILTHSEEIPGGLARTLEAEVHRRLGEKRTRGEWFAVTPREAHQAITKAKWDIGITPRLLPDAPVSADARYLALTGNTRDSRHNAEVARARALVGAYQYAPAHPRKKDPPHG